MSTEALVEEARPELDVSPEGEHDRFSHLVGEKALARAKLTGEPVRALCGKIWHPTAPNPTEYPLCPLCAELGKRFYARANN